MKHKHSLILCIPAVLAYALLAIGCSQKAKETVAEKKPRPVEVRILQNTPPPSSSLVTGSVASWKTEELSMEVAGRIEWVVEPNTFIEIPFTDEDGTEFPSTPIAKIDDERYRLQVATAEAQVNRAEQSIAAAKTELENSIPAQIRAAEAEKKLALIEFERSKRLFDQDAGAEADVDRDEARYENAISTIQQLKSLQKTKASDLASLKLELVQNEKALEDAKADLEDCTLFTSFEGQISDINVVPGSVVGTGQAVATIQLMNPIKIELEVSSETSRQIRGRQMIPVYLLGNTGSEEDSSEPLDGYLYLVDSVADPLTRTFTLTLLVLNKRLDDFPADSVTQASTNQMWRLDFEFIPGAEPGKNYAPEEAILEDEEGPFLWRIHNVQVSQRTPVDRILQVSKLRVKRGEALLPFLGNWDFQEIEILDDTFDVTKNLVAGRLSIPKGDRNEWDGNAIMLQRNRQWMLRPGDLVNVDLSDNQAKRGIFVPMDAISFSNDKAHLFLIDKTDQSIVRKVEVLIAEPNRMAPTSSVLQVLPVSESESLEGRRYVTRGVHYLRDGEKVDVVLAEGIE